MQETEVEIGTIEIGSGGEREGEEESEAHVPSQAQVPSEAHVPSEAQVPSEGAFVGGSDPLLTLPLAEISGGSDIQENEEKEEGKKAEEKEEEEEKDVEEEKEEEEEEEEEEDEEEEDGKDRREPIGTFYRARRQYFNGDFDGKMAMVRKLLKANKKVAAKMDDADNPVTGPYFILVKEPPTGNDETDKTAPTSILFFPEKATYLTSGDVKVTVLAKKIEEVKEIPIPIYRPLTTEELFHNIDVPKGRLEIAQKNYNEAFINMRVAFSDKEHSNLKRRMNTLQLKDRQLLQARFPFRAVQKEENILLQDLLFDRKHDDTKLDIGRFIGTTVSLQKRYVTNAPPPSQTPLGPAKNVLVINQPEGDNGILSPFYNQVSFMMEGIVYNSPYQAIMALLAIDPVIKKSQKEKEALKGEIERLANPQDIVYFDTNIRMGEDEALIEGALTGLIKKVYREVLPQIPPMALALRATGNAELVVVPQERALDSFLGVGIDPTEMEGVPPKQRFVIQNPERWQGRNMYANVLMELRKAILAQPQGAPVLVEEAPVLVEGDVPPGSIELNDLDEQVGEDEVPASVLQLEETGP